MTVNSSPPSRATSGASVAHGRPHLVLPFPAAGAKPGRYVAEELVAHFMAQGVVDPAEMIEVDEERRHQPLVPAGLLQGVSQPLLVREPVGEPGEAVVVGQLADLLQHSRVGQGDGGLVGQPAHLHPILFGWRPDRSARPGQ